MPQVANLSKAQTMPDARLDLSGAYGRIHGICDVLRPLLALQVACLLAGIGHMLRPCRCSWRSMCAAGPQSQQHSRVTLVTINVSIPNELQPVRVMQIGPTFSWLAPQSSSALRGLMVMHAAGHCVWQELSVER